MALNQPTINPTSGITELVSSVSFTNNWVDIGPMVKMYEYDSIVFWLDITLNDSTDIFFRPIGFQVANSDKPYLFPTEEIWTGINKFYPKKYELQDKVTPTQLIMFQVNTAKMIPYVGIQIVDDTASPTTRAIINSIKFSVR